VSRSLVIVPALNEASNIARVITALREHVPADVVVINDGSTDGTGAIARQLGVSVIDMPFNVGIGAAVQSGLLFALRRGYSLAIQVDGDGQHPPAEIRKLMTRIESEDCDVVIGSRFVERSSYRGSIMRRTGIAIFWMVNALILRRRITDSTSGFRAFNRAAIEFLASEYPHDFPEPESIVTLCRNGFRVVEVPVEMKARANGRSSITLLRSFYYMLKVLIAMTIGATRRRKRKTS
jgi:glycosyltransferase involved in cell wall biosynthesis